MTLYQNASGDSCLKNWSLDELRDAYFIAERENDDILYLAVMSEVERRKIVAYDPPK